QSTSKYNNGIDGIGFTDGGLSLTFTQLADSAWTLDVTPNGGSLHSYSSLDFGSLTASDISQVRVFDYNPGSGNGSNDVFVHNLAVVPEPSSVSLLLSASTVGGFYLLRRRGA